MQPNCFVEDKMTHFKNLIHAHLVKLWNYKRILSLITLSNLESKIYAFQIIVDNDQQHLPFQKCKKYFLTSIRMKYKRHIDHGNTCNSDDRPFGFGS